MHHSGQYPIHILQDYQQEKALFSPDLLQKSIVFTFFFGARVENLQITLCLMQQNKMLVTREKVRLSTISKVSFFLTFSYSMHVYINVLPFYWWQESLLWANYILSYILKEYTYLSTFEWNMPSGIILYRMWLWWIRKSHIYVAYVAKHSHKILALWTFLEHTLLKKHIILDTVPNPSHRIYI